MKQDVNFNNEENRTLIKLLSNYLKQFDYIDFALLFGSFAENKANILSDIDLGIFTNKDVSLIDVGFLAAKTESILRREIDVVILNDLYKKKPLIAYEIISKGKLLFYKSHEKFIEFKKNTFLYFLDIQHLRNMVDKTFRERLHSGRFGERNYVRKA